MARESGEMEGLTCEPTNWQENSSVNVTLFQPSTRPSPVAVNRPTKSSEKKSQGNMLSCKLVTAMCNEGISRIPVPSCTSSHLDNGNSNTFERVKVEQVNLIGATADESMAVEALSQLGGMFDMGPNIPTSFVEPSPLCDICGMQFISSSELRKHASASHQRIERIHVCSVCGERFERKLDLGNHIVCHQTERPHSCRVCGNLFRRKADLYNHMVSHQLNRQHQCPECGIDFQRPSSLTNHMKIHQYHPGRSMMSAALADLSRETNGNILKIPITKIVEEDLQELIPFATEEIIIPQAVYHETIGITSENQTIGSSNIDLPVGLAAYDGNSNDANFPSLSNTNVDYQDIQLAQQSDSNEELHHFNYFPDITECTTVDVETTVASTNSDENFPVISNFKSDESNLKLDSEKFNNAPVKVEAVPYFLPDDSEIAGEAVFSVDSSGRQFVTMPPKSVGARPHICGHCGTAFSRVKALQSHVRLHQEYWGNSLDCKRCAQTFPDSSALRQHQEDCKIQRKTESIEKNILSTRPVGVAHATKGKHPCTNCEKKFTTKQKLFRHMWIHRKKLYACEVCGVNMATLEALDNHRRSLHPGDSPFVCQSCGKSFASRQGLWEHGRVHGGTNTSLFWCHECNKSFSSRQGYLIHTRTHTGERPYGCRFCLKAFRDGGTLRKHERIHTGERPHVCPISTCYRAFNQKVVLREHVRWVHAANRSGEENDDEHLYVCQVCNLLLGDREELCAHIVKHSDDLAKAAKNKDSSTSVTVVQVPVKTAKSKKLVSVKKTSKKTKLLVPSKLIAAKTETSILSNGSASSPVEKLNGPLTPSKSYTFVGDVSTVKEEHTCGMCDETFGDRVQLLSHVRIHI